MKWNEIVINRFQEHEKNEDQKQVSNKQNNNDNDKYYSDEDPFIEKIWWILILWMNSQSKINLSTNQVKPLMPSVNQNVTQSYTQSCSFQLSFKYLWPFRAYQTRKG